MIVEIKQKHIDEAVVWAELRNSDSSSEWVSKDLTSSCIVARALIDAGFPDPVVSYEEFKCGGVTSDDGYYQLVDALKYTNLHYKDWSEAEPGFIVVSDEAAERYLNAD